MVSSTLSRLIIGLLIAATVLFFYLINFDLLFLFLLLMLITYDFFYVKIANIFFLIFLFLLTILSFSFISFQSFENLFFLQTIFIMLIIFSNKYKEQFFVFSVYIFCLILFYLVKTDRNLFYLLFLISFFNDTIAYISGRFFSGPRILPKISPNKTWSGTLISLVLTSFLLFYMNFNILISIVFSISLFFGDIFFSHIKRFLDIKDFSPLLGSHGGILDRLDSIFFIAIFFQIYLVFVL